VLGGYANLSSPDIKFSLRFMIELFKANSLIKRETVLDCGAGIGRISKDLLTKMYKAVNINMMKVDISDQCEKYIEAAKKNLESYKNVRNFYAVGMQDFQFN
jgi:protein N-terminal methyltransferase